jgi:hypothetical protein
MVFVSGSGTTAVKGEAFTPAAATIPPMRTANLPAMPLRNCLLSFCIQAPSFRKILIARILHLDLTPIARLFFARFDAAYALGDEAIRGILAPY